MKARKKNKKRDKNSRNYGDASLLDFQSTAECSPTKHLGVNIQTSEECCLWIPTGKLFDSCTSKVDSEPPHGSNVDIPNIHECKQTLDVSADTSINVQKEQSLDLSADTLCNVNKENLRVWLLKKLISQKPLSRIQKREDENIESEPINAYFKNNRAVYRDYLKVTKEHATTLQELLDQARALKHLDEHIGYDSKFTTQIQELVVYVSASCPFTQSGNEKWAPATSHIKNNKPYVDASRSKQTVVNDTKKHAVKQNTQKTDNTMLHSTRRVSYTDASG
ncbi:hypothetical protein Tco_0355561 [Tanacetum coccineum]